MCIYDKGTLHLMLCDHHTAAGDVFFPVYTQVAEWGIYVVAVLLMLYKFGWGCFLLVSNWVAGGIGQIIKHIAQAPRPVTWFAQHYPDVQLPAIEGIEFKEWNSFPSGHTITFFCLFLVLTMVIEELYHTAKRSYSVSGLSAAGGLSAKRSFSAAVYRNHDSAFLRSLHAERRILVDIVFSETPTGFALTIGEHTATFDYPHEPARNADQALQTIRTQLAKLGDTPYEAREIHINLSQPYFIPIATLNQWRRQLTQNL